jgi:hypothetical protein
MPELEIYETQIILTLFSIIVSAVISAVIAFALDALRDSRRNRVELRREHLKNIKEEVLTPMLRKLDQYDSSIVSNLHDRSKEPSDLKDPVPVQSKLYDGLAQHFPEAWESWSEYRRLMEEWSIRCVELFNSIRDPAQLDIEVRLPCTCHLVWHHMAYHLIKDVYYDLFSGDAHRSIDGFQIKDLSVGNSSVEFGGGSTGIPKENIRGAEAMKKTLHDIVEKSLESAKSLNEAMEMLRKPRQDAESEIRKALAVLELNGTCEYCP